MDRQSFFHGWTKVLKPLDLLWSLFSQSQRMTPTEPTPSITYEAAFLCSQLKKKYTTTTIKPYCTAIVYLKKSKYIHGLLLVSSCLTPQHFPHWLAIHYTEIASKLAICLTGHFTIQEPRDQEIGNFYVVQERSATNTDVPKLWKGRSGALRQLERGTVAQLAGVHHAGRQTDRPL